MLRHFGRRDERLESLLYGVLLQGGPEEALSSIDAYVNEDETDANRSASKQR